MWLIALTPITAFGFAYQIIAEANRDRYKVHVGEIIGALFIAAIPGILGRFLFKGKPDQT